jgi:hypothetical protein
LEHIGSCHFLSEFSCVGDVLKDLSPGNIFENDSNAFVGLSIFLLIGSIIENIDKVDKILMVEFLHHFDLVLKSFHVGIHLMSLLKDFDCNLLTILRVQTKFHFGVESGS